MSASENVAHDPDESRATPSEGSMGSTFQGRLSGPPRPPHRQGVEGAPSQPTSKVQRSLRSPCPCPKPEPGAGT